MMPSITHYPLLLAVLVCFSGITLTECFAPHTSSFGMLNLNFNIIHQVNHANIATQLYINRNSLENRYFQLEELEDKDTATTEVFLASDSSIIAGESDGPLPSSTNGTWKIRDDKIFEMTITRTFSVGQKSTDMGEFSYDVERYFAGEIVQVGAAIAVTGAIHSADPTLGDVEVGFFNMIDTTDEKYD